MFVAGYLITALGYLAMQRHYPGNYAYLEIIWYFAGINVFMMTFPIFLICRRLEGEFLDYRSAIPRTNPIVLTVEAKALMTAVDRVSVVISDKMKSPVRCRFDSDCVTLTAKTGSGEAKDVCRLSGDGDGLEIGFNNRYLMDALRFAPADTLRLELNTGISPAILVPVEGEENFLYMVLPVRLKGSDHV